MRTGVQKHKNGNIDEGDVSGSLAPTYCPRIRVTDEGIWNYGDEMRIWIFRKAIRLARYENREVTSITISPVDIDVKGKSRMLCFQLAFDDERDSAALFFEAMYGNDGILICLEPISSSSKVSSSSKMAVH